MHESLDVLVRPSLHCNILIFSNLSSVLFILVSGIMLSFRFGVLKVTLDLRGCPRGQNSYARHFKGKHGKLYIVGKLNKCRFWKKI